MERKSWLLAAVGVAEMWDFFVCRTPATLQV
jgi:hypothetical protein